MSAPKRIQRKRTKGYRLPPDAVYVGRPSRWGNPFQVGPAVYYCVAAGRPGAAMNTSPPDAVRLYRDWLAGRIFDCEVREYDHLGISTPRRVPAPPEGSQIQLALMGCDLACWCPLDSPCHGDVLLEIANREATDA